MFITIFQTIIALLLIVAVLMQSQGSGISAAFGGGGEFYRSRRSLERFLIGATIVLATIFSLLSVALLVFH
ncbi:MAG: preprotein translocase subunit SecG [Candidatus Levybacteria bacterium]|nr:preprotein translocase subunit SecG [Candidatus Levybacteria bacterium]